MWSLEHLLSPLLFSYVVARTFSVASLHIHYLAKGLHGTHEMITPPRSPADCPRSSNRNEIGKFHGGGQGPKLGCRATGGWGKKLSTITNAYALSDGETNLTEINVDMTRLF
jgi:hypothetical protein